MIPRYTLPEMGAIWTEENKFRKWLEVEIAVCEAHAELGNIPSEAVQIIKEKAKFDVARIAEIEKVVQHDVIAFLTCVAEQIGPESRFVHYGMTSSDVIDTANALLLRESAELIIEKLKRLSAVLRRRAFDFKRTAMIGRTHGVHAEPTTFGLKLALWYEDTKRNLERIERAREAVSVGKISGAVGTFAHLDPEIEERTCQKLGLKPDPVSTQIIQRDRYAEFLAALAIIGSCLEKMALEVRHLQRTEVREVEEFFGTGQKGSSSMPHKRNPITAEQICGLARVLRANAHAAMENIALWHERDISHSSVERVILPDSCILTDYVLHRTTGLMEGLVVFPERMMENLLATRGLIFSGELLLVLAERGLTREEAYDLVQRNAMRVWDKGVDFSQLVLDDHEIAKVLSRTEIEEIFSLDRMLRNVDKIFDRVLAHEHGRSP